MEVHELTKMQNLETLEKKIEAAARVGAYAVERFKTQNVTKIFPTTASTES